MRWDDTDRLFDKRVVRRNIAAGLISKDDHERFIEALADASKNVKPRDEGGDEDGLIGYHVKIGQRKLGPLWARTT